MSELMKVLITGGTGFLGRRTAHRLFANNHEVSVLGRNPKAGKKLAEQGITFVQTDICDPVKVRQACQGVDVVIHAAALASPYGRYPDFYRANVEGTENLLSACEQQGVKRLVNISTPSIYFDYRHRKDIRESDPLPARQVTHYGNTKLKADRLVEKAGKNGLEWISLRPRAIVGPGDTSVLPRVIQNVRGGTFPLINGGRSFIDMVYIDNVVDAIELAMNASTKALGRVYNITNATPMTVRQMVEKLFKKLEQPVRFRNVPFKLAYPVAWTVENLFSLAQIRKEPPITRYAIGLMAKSQTLNIEQAKSVLGYEPKISLDEGFSHFVRWWQTQN